MTVDVDIIIVGAGLSGIAAACYLQKSCPDLSFAILEARNVMGGTWDLFRYPGIRSDSDMFTLGYSFRPWRSSKPISDGESILTYIRETASEHGLYDRIRVGHKVIRAEWSSADAVWTVHVSRAEGTSFLRARFVFSCAGYYDYEAGYLPKLPSIDEYTGAFFHAQSWPKEMSALGKRVTVIGSGATAVTLVPELAKSAAHVTMLQRTPSYVVSVPSTDWFADRARRTLPPMLSHAVSRWYFCLGSPSIRLAKWRQMW